MKNEDLMGVLREAPRISLEILQMAQEATLPDGSIDFEAIAAQEARLARAATQAKAEARAAGQLAKGVLWKMRG